MSILKRVTPRMSDHVMKFAANHYAAFYVGTYLARRDIALIEARYALNEDSRMDAVREARSNHRNYMRCLREARREGLMS